MGFMDRRLWVPKSKTFPCQHFLENGAPCFSASKPLHSSKRAETSSAGSFMPYRMINSSHSVPAKVQGICQKVCRHYPFCLGYHLAGASHTSRWCQDGVASGASQCQRLSGGFAHCSQVSGCRRGFAKGCSKLLAHLRNL